MRYNTTKYNVAKTLQNLFEAVPERRSVVMAMESTEEESAPPEHQDELQKWWDNISCFHMEVDGDEEKFLPLEFLNAGEKVLIPFVKLSVKEKEAVLTKAEKLHFRVWGYRSQNIFVLNERPMKIRQTL